jgi:hypothetical protein
MHTSAMMKVEVNEMKHAFRVNGVTFSRKKLGELFPEWGNEIQTLYRFMVIAPFLAETKEVSDAPTELGRYAIAKAKRIHEALAFPDRDAIAPFMMMAGQMGKIDPDDFGDIATALHNNICGCGKDKRLDSIIDRARRTLH